MRGKVGAMLSMAAALGAFDAPDYSNTRYVPRKPEADYFAKKSAIEKAQAKREARNRRVSERMRKGA